MLPDPWLDEETAESGLKPSAFPDRTQLLQLIVSAVPSPSTHGVVVVGDRGSGKSGLLRAVKAALPANLDVRSFAGTPELAATPYGILNALNEAYEDQGTPPGLNVLRAFTRTLGPAQHLFAPGNARRRSRGGPPSGRPPLVLLVDDIQHIDQASLAVLLQLIPGFGATLVATADSGGPLPQDLYQLWEDGFLEQYALPPLTFPEAHQVCRSILGGNVQERASALLCALSGFNVGFLRLAIEDALEAGLLVLRHGFWTIDAGLHCHWPRVVRRVECENAQRPDEEREALELVALAEPLPLETVERSYGQVVVERLLASHHLRLLAGRPPLIRTASWLFGEGTRRSVPASRSIALRLAADVPSLTPASAPTMLRWLTWTLACGLPLPEELLLAAAPAADRPSTAALALRATAAVAGVAHRDEVRLVTARALVAEGRLREAALELRQLAAAGIPAEVRVSAADRLAALELLGVVEGEPSGVSEDADSLTGAVRESERLVLAGNFRAGLAPSSAAMDNIAADPRLEVFRPGVILRHMVALRYSLAWEEADGLLESATVYALPLHVALCHDVARGYTQLSQGLLPTAQRTLEPAVAELSDAGLPAVYSLATAMLAYVEAATGQTERATARIKESGAAMARIGTGQLLPQLAGLFTAAAQDAADAPSGYLLHLAGRFRAEGRPTLEAEALSLSVLNKANAGVAADDPVIGRLTEVAGSLDGAWASSLGKFASALGTDNPRLLELAGKSLASDRQFAHAAMCYSRAASGYDASGRWAAGRRAAGLLQRLPGALESEVAPSPGGVLGTTAGEVANGTPL
ncbi:ATP-binding protein [Arthrobacter sp. fls2-241-R2A-200]|uniref:ATP-binding protein n=1 Tax=Arthrobacter sp. fls2-241-R2A-200 TaxID=3040281 RepID=UPI002550DE72|nr:ATP-binding protein [Arthrobacter sp. fls2-241-R2A-200]